MHLPCTCRDRHLEPLARPAPASLWPMVGTGILAVSAIVTVMGWWFFAVEMVRLWTR